MITELLGVGAVGYLGVTLGVARRAHARLMVVARRPVVEPAPVARHFCNRYLNDAPCNRPATAEVTWFCRGCGEKWSTWQCERCTSSLDKIGCRTCKRDGRATYLEVRGISHVASPPVPAQRSPYRRALARGVGWPVWGAGWLVRFVVTGGHRPPKLPYLTDAEVAALERTALSQDGEKED